MKYSVNISHLKSAWRKLREPRKYKPIEELTGYLIPAEIIALANYYGGIEHLHDVVIARRDLASGNSNPRWFYLPKRLIGKEDV